MSLDSEASGRKQSPFTPDERRVFTGELSDSTRTDQIPSPILPGKLSFKPFNSINLVCRAIRDTARRLRAALQEPTPSTSFELPDYLKAPTYPDDSSDFRETDKSIRIYNCNGNSKITGPLNSAKPLAESRTTQEMLACGIQEDQELDPFIPLDDEPYEGDLKENLLTRIHFYEETNHFIAQKAYQRYLQRYPNPRPSNIEEQWPHLVPAIESEPILFRSSLFEFPTTLPWLNNGMFLKCIREKGWYEALDSLSDSQKGAHFINAHTPKGEIFPYLSAIIKVMGVKRGKYPNLFRLLFFRKDWEAKIGRQGVKEQMEAFKAFWPEEERREYDYNLIPEDPTLEELQEGFIQMVGEDEVEEVTRALFDEEALKQNKYLVLETIAKMAQDRVSAGKRFTYITVENGFYKPLLMLQRRSGIPLFMTFSEKIIPKEDPKAYQGKTYHLCLCNLNVAQAGELVLKRKLN